MRATAAKGELPLQECIRKGLKEQTAAATAALLKTTAPLDVINQELIPALDVVGKGFEKGTVFLPQLLMSAEAAKAAFDVIKQQMADSGVVQEKKGKIILATVKGDIHDIGKNIVKVLLENYSYDVIDLGRDVPPETIVETALAQQVKLVGLSALMTTTVPSVSSTQLPPPSRSWWAARCSPRNTRTPFTPMPTAKTLWHPSTTPDRCWGRKEGQGV